MSLHMMVDLETLDNVPSSKILSIGAVIFDANGSFLKTFYKDVDLTGQENRTISDSTFRWWLRQSDEARGALSAEVAQGRVKLGSALSSLTALIGGDSERIKVWGNGASFDNAILAHAYREAGAGLPWRFWNDRCFRTIKSTYRETPEPARQGTHHNALDDAKHQAHHLIAIHRARIHAGGIL